MAITTLNGMLAALDAATHQRIPWHKSVPSTPSIGVQHSLWTGAGMPGNGVAPGSLINGVLLDNTSTGAIPFASPGGGNTLYLSKCDISSTFPGVVLVFDRLWHNQFANATSTSLQSITQPTLTRPDANGEDAELWFNVWSATGAGSGTATVIYTNQDGVGSRTATATVTASVPTTRQIPFALQAGDTGVQSIQSYQQNATFSSGTIGLVLRRRIKEVAISPASGASVAGPVKNGLPEIYPGTCFEFLWSTHNGNLAVLLGEIGLVEG